MRNTNAVIENSSYQPNTCHQECDENYIYNPDENETQCIIQCDAGYKRIENNTCQPCDINHYKEGVNTLTECIQCPIGSTTGDNNTASNINNCTARPGYKRSDNSYSPIYGNIDSDKNGIIDGCKEYYYYNNIECETCEPFGDGIRCEGGDIEYNEDDEASNLSYT